MTGSRRSQAFFLMAEPGEIVGLLGPSGAGKTTTVAMFCGLIAPDRGEVTGGEPDDLRGQQLKRRIGVAPQELAIYEDLRALANVELFAALYVPRAAGRKRRRRAASSAAPFLSKYLTFRRPRLRRLRSTF